MTSRSRTTAQSHTSARGNAMRSGGGDEHDKINKAMPPGTSSSFSANPASHRTGTRYKEKFQALRERYDQVNAIHTEHQRELDKATAKLKEIQAENDLLLDTIALTMPTVQLRQPQPPFYVPSQQRTHAPPAAHPYPVAVQPIIVHPQPVSYPPPSPSANPYPSPNQTHAPSNPTPPVHPRHTPQGPIPPAQQQQQQSHTYPSSDRGSNNTNAPSVHSGWPEQQQQLSSHQQQQYPPHPAYTNGTNTRHRPLEMYDVTPPEYAAAVM